MDKELPIALSALVRVEVSSENIIPGKSGSNERGAYTVPPKQVCYLWQYGETYPTRFELACPEVGPRRPGLYLLAGKCFAPGEFGRLKFTGDRQLDLVSFEEVAAAFAKTPLKAAA